MDRDILANLRYRSGLKQGRNTGFFWGWWDWRICGCADWVVWSL